MHSTGDMPRRVSERVAPGRNATASTLPLRLLRLVDPVGDLGPFRTSPQTLEDHASIAYGGRQREPLAVLRIAERCVENATDLHVAGIGRTSEHAELSAVHEALSARPELARLKWIDGPVTLIFEKR